MKGISRLGCLGFFALLTSASWADGCKLGDYGTLPVEMLDGRATTMVKINGSDTRFVLDTGASFNFKVAVSVPVSSRSMFMGENLGRGLSCVRREGLAPGTAGALTGLPTTGWSTDGGTRTPTPHGTGS